MLSPKNIYSKQCDENGKSFTAFSKRQQFSEENLLDRIQGVTYN